MTLGVNIVELTLLTPADRQRVLSDAAAFGFRHVRFGVSMKLVCPSKGRYVWDAVVNARDLARANGTELLPILPTDSLNLPSWATPADFGDFCGRAATILGAPAYEIGNEPNLNGFNPFGKAATYAPWLSAAYDGIKRAWPTATVIAAGLAAAVTYSGFNWFFWLGPFGAWANTSPETFLADLVKLVPAKFDEAAYHPYSLGPGFDLQPPSAGQVMIAKTKALQAITPKPLHLTEWGYDMAKVAPAQAAAWFTTQLPLMAATGGPNRGYLFAWRDYAGHGGTYGLVDANNVARQPFYDTVLRSLKS
jgi:hypothetical protein